MNKMINDKLYNINKDNIEISESIKIYNKEIFLGDLLTKSKIISYDSLIVFGDIDCEYLLVSGDLICFGKINAQEIDIEGKLLYSNYPDGEKVNICGEQIEIKAYNSFNINELDIEKDIYNDSSILENIHLIKDLIIKDLSNIKEDDYYNKIYTLFNKLGKYFKEFELYKNFLGVIIQVESNCMYISEYLFFKSKISEMPEWILNLDTVKEKVSYIECTDVNSLINDINTDESLIKCCHYLYKCKNISEESYDYLKNEILKVRIGSKNLNSLDDKKAIISKSIDEIYEDYLLKGKNRSIATGTIKSIESNKIILEFEDGTEATLLDIYDIGDKSLYNIGDKLSAYILKVTKGDAVEVDLYRSSKLFIYDSISKLELEDLKRLSRTDVHLLNSNEIILIINKIDPLKVKDIETHIQNELKFKNIKILDELNDKGDNLSKLFDIDKCYINNSKQNEYTIKVIEESKYLKINKKLDKCQDILDSLDIYKVIIDKINIRTIYNKYLKKNGKIEEGTVIKSDNEKTYIRIESNVIGIIDNKDLNKVYSTGDLVLFKIQSISLDEDIIYLKGYNKYEEFIKELIEYKIELLGININYQMIVKRNIKNGKSIDIQIIDDNLDKNKIEDLIIFVNKNIDNNLHIVTYSQNNKIINSNKKSFESEQLKLNNENISIDTKALLSESDILKEFIRNRKSCGVPEVRPLKCYRIPGYKTLIISSKLSLYNSRDNLMSLEFEMNSMLKDEKVRIAVYDSIIEVMIADILDINKNQIEITKGSRTINIKLNKDEYEKIKLNEKKEAKLIEGVLPYYKIKFHQDKENDINDQILDMLFK